MEDGTFSEGSAGVGDVNGDGDELDSGTTVITFDTVLHDGVEQTSLRSNYNTTYTVTTDNDPATGFTSVSGSISHSSEIFSAVLFDSTFAQRTDLNFSWSYNGFTNSFELSFDASEAGTYYVRTAESLIAELAGQFVDFVITIDSDGNATIALN